MKKFEVVQTNQEFNEIINSGKVVKNKYFNIYYKVNDLSFSKYGLAIGKKIGNAVIRNRYKRKIRSIIDNNKFLFKKNYNYIIIMKKEGLDLSFSQLSSYFIELIEKVNS